MTDEWKKAVLGLRHRTTEGEDLAFVALIDQAIGKCDLDTCRVLMHTFVTDQDFGVQESVTSALSTARTADRQAALLEELPRLISEAPESATDMVESEIRFHRASFKHSIHNASEIAKRVVAELLKDESIIRQFPDLSL